jgi:hypothetical protein
MPACSKCTATGVLRAIVKTAIILADIHRRPIAALHPHAPFTQLRLQQSGSYMHGRALGMQQVPLFGLVMWHVPEQHSTSFWQKLCGSMQQRPPAHWAR